MRSKPEFGLISPLLQSQKINTDLDELYCRENIELALLRLPEEAWKSVAKPSIIKRDDDTYVTGDPFFDELEEALSQGDNIDGILSRLQLPTT